LNPLHIGMVLAGADCHNTDAITDYAMHTGKAFQITDDILGTFGSEFESGKSPMDDTREGKRTLLTLYALEHTNHANKNFLIQMLGNAGLTPAEFERCKDILIESGALTYAQTQAKTHIEQAITALDKEADRWSAEGTQFLRGLAQYLLTRTA
jgi:geranylgeranyl diphosphate synthase type I